MRHFYERTILVNTGTCEVKKGPTLAKRDVQFVFRRRILPTVLDVNPAGNLSFNGNCEMEPVSVVIPTYQRAALLPETLASVVSGLSDDDEIIVVDDGSTDNTATVVGDTGAPWRGRVRYIPLPKAGAGRAFNAGIASARHDLVAFADSDDLWLPYRLALERPVMASERSLAYCFSNFSQLTKDGRLVPHWLVKWSNDSRPWDDILAAGFRYADRWALPATLPSADAGFRVHIGSMYHPQLRQNYMCVNTLLVRRSVAGDALQFGVDLPRLADWECYARLARTGNGAYLYCA